MNIESELVGLCEEFMSILYELKEKSLISEEEFSNHSRYKIKCIKDYTIKTELQ